MRVAYVLAVCLSLVLTVQAAGEEQQTIRIATEGANPPFNYLDQNNEPQGFEIDLGKALCAAMKVKCTFVVHEWEGMIRGLINREYDAVMSSLEMTERRQKRIAFSRRYYLMPAAFIALKDASFPSITPAALAGKKIGTTERSEHAAFLDDLYKSAEVQTYAKLDDAELDLVMGRLDLVLGDKLTLSRFIQSREGACCRFVADVPVDPTYHGRGVGIGLRKEDQDLKAMFDRAIEQVIANGTYDRIRAQYFPFDIK